MFRPHPRWLEEAQNLCHAAGISIAGWGRDQLVVEAESSARAREIAAKLEPLGFTAIEDEDDNNDRLLTLARGRLTLAIPKSGSTYVHQPAIAQASPIIDAVYALLLLRFDSVLSMPFVHWAMVCSAIYLIVSSAQNAVRIWGWEIQSTPQGLKLRESFHASMIPWERIQSVHATSTKWRPNHAAVVLRLTEQKTVGLGNFPFVFARNLRDRLRAELAQRKRPA